MFMISNQSRAQRFFEERGMVEKNIINREVKLDARDKLRFLDTHSSMTKSVDLI